MNKFESHLKTLGQDTLNDMSCHDWSGVPLNALYDAVGAKSDKEKAAAKREARSWAEHMVSRRN